MLLLRGVWAVKIWVFLGAEQIYTITRCLAQVTNVSTLVWVPISPLYNSEWSFDQKSCYFPKENFFLGHPVEYPCQTTFLVNQHSLSMNFPPQPTHGDFQTFCLVFFKVSLIIKLLAQNSTANKSKQKHQLIFLILASKFMIHKIFDRYPLQSKPTMKWCLKYYTIKINCIFLEANSDHKTFFLLGFLK